MKEKAIEKSWAAVGLDTSMTAISAVAVGHDALLDRRVGPVWRELRWMPDVACFVRRTDTAKSHDLILDLLAELSFIKGERVYIAQEEPFPMGMLGGKTFQAGFAKQLAEISGSMLGSLLRYGYRNIEQINNVTWKKALRVEYGVEVPRKFDAAKWVTKVWAMEQYGMPDLPDLVSSKSGAKIPRPESGYGARAKAVQPLDIYDAAGICAWMESVIPTRV